MDNCNPTIEERLRRLQLIINKTSNEQSAETLVNKSEGWIGKQWAAFDNAFSKWQNGATTGGSSK